MEKKKKIDISPSKRGTFTASAQRRGISVRALEKKVLAHPENYSSALVKKANFSRNARLWRKKK